MVVRSAIGSSKDAVHQGNHEDSVWLDAQLSAEILPNIFYLPNGRAFDLGGVVVGGVGGCHGPSDYQRCSRDLHGYAKRHYTRDEIDILIAHGPVDILLMHEHRRASSLSGIAAGSTGRVKLRVSTSSSAGCDRVSASSGITTRAFGPKSPAFRASG